MVLSDIALVALGGGTGSLLRWLVGKLLTSPARGGIPWSTVAVNLIGAFVMGYLSVLFSIEWHDRYGSFLKAAILTGVLGGFTTFSTMELDTAKMAGATGAGAGAGTAAGYILGQTVLGIAVAGLGAGLAHAAG